MKVCAIKELVNQNFNVIFVNALQQFWHTTKSFQCFGNPKKQNLFLFLNYFFAPALGRFAPYFERR